MLLSYDRRQCKEGQRDGGAAATGRPNTRCAGSGAGQVHQPHAQPDAHEERSTQEGRQGQQEPAPQCGPAAQRGPAAQGQPTPHREPEVHEPEVHTERAPQERHAQQETAPQCEPAPPPEGAQAPHREDAQQERQAPKEKQAQHNEKALQEGIRSKRAREKEKQQQRVRLTTGRVHTKAQAMHYRGVGRLEAAMRNFVTATARLPAGGRAECTRQTRCELDTGKRTKGKGTAHCHTRGFTGGRAFIADAAVDGSDSDCLEDEGLSDLERDEAEAASSFIDDGSQSSKGACIPGTHTRGWILGDAYSGVHPRGRILGDAYSLGEACSGRHARGRILGEAYSGVHTRGAHSGVLLGHKLEPHRWNRPRRHEWR